jgi:hypothetical protein
LQTAHSKRVKRGVALSVVPQANNLPTDRVGHIFFNHEPHEKARKFLIGVAALTDGMASSLNRQDAKNAKGTF